MKNRLLLFTLAFSLLDASAGAEPPPQGAPLKSDAQHSGWRLRRTATLAAGAAAQHGFAALPLWPELKSAAAADWRDLRLSAAEPGEAEGGDLPYIIHRQAALAEEDVYEGKLVDTRHEPKQKSSWVVSLDEARSFERITLKIDERGFKKRLTIESADSQGGPFRVLQSDVGVFDQPWSSAPDLIIHHTEVAIAGGATARYLRITADDRKSAPIELSGLTVHRRRAAPGTFWQREVALIRDEGSSKQPAAAHHGTHRPSRYRLDVPSGFPLEEAELVSSTQTFARRVELVEEGGQRVALGSGLVYRLSGQPSGHAAKHGSEAEPHAEQLGEQTAIRLSEKPGAGALYLEVHDGDSPPLAELRLRARGTSERLVFPVGPAGAAGPPGSSRPRTFTLYYGNDKTRPPAYDLEALKEQLSQLRKLPVAALGPEEQNASYRPVPPLSFVAGIGAPLDVRSFRASRLLNIPGAEDIYAVVLPPEDLGYVRQDAGDLRITDGQGRQVPYVLDKDAAERSVPLEFRAEAAPDQSTHRSRYRISYTKGEHALPLRALDLQFSDTYYVRAVRVLALPSSPETDAPPARRHLLRPRREGQRPTEQPLYSGELAHNEAADGAVAVHRLVLPRHAGEHRELILEIDNGDNAELNLRQVSGVVVAPRLCFKLKPDAAPYRLYFGAPELPAPSYDIERLRELVLNYSALPVELSAMEPNAAFRSSSSEYLHGAPPGLILWGGLLATLAILLFLTLRLLKQPQQ